MQNWVNEITKNPESLLEFVEKQVHPHKRIELDLNEVKIFIDQSLFAQRIWSLPKNIDMTEKQREVVSLFFESYYKSISVNNKASKDQPATGNIYEELI